MSGTLTVPFRKRLLEHVFRGTPLFGSMKIALTRKAPSANSSVAQLDEPVAMGYARQTIGLDTASWALTISGEVGNVNQIYFPTATGTWGVLTGWALISVEASPIVCAVGTLVTPYRAVATRRVYVPPNGLVVGLYD